MYIDSTTKQYWEYSKQSGRVCGYLGDDHGGVSKELNASNIPVANATDGETSQMIFDNTDEETGTQIVFKILDSWQDVTVEQALKLPGDYWCDNDQPPHKFFLDTDNSTINETNARLLREYHAEGGSEHEIAHHDDHHDHPEVLYLKHLSGHYHGKSMPEAHRRKLKKWIKSIDRRRQKYYANVYQYHQHINGKERRFGNANSNAYAAMFWEMTNAAYGEKYGNVNPNNPKPELKNVQTTMSGSETMTYRDQEAQEKSAKVDKAYSNVYEAAGQDLNTNKRWTWKVLKVCIGSLGGRRNQRAIYLRAKFSANIWFNVISFAGSDDVSDWIHNNFKAIPKKGITGRYYHKGFWEYQQSLRSCLYPMETKYGAPHFITGHSLGGAAATVYAQEWHDDMKTKGEFQKCSYDQNNNKIQSTCTTKQVVRIGVVTFGAPKTNSRLDPDTTVHGWRVLHYMDPVGSGFRGIFVGLYPYEHVVATAIKLDIWQHCNTKTIQRRVSKRKEECHKKRERKRKKRGWSWGWSWWDKLVCFMKTIWYYISETVRSCWPAEMLPFETDKNYGASLLCDTNLPGIIWGAATQHVSYQKWFSQLGATSYNKIYNNGGGGEYSKLFTMFPDALQVSDWLEYDPSSELPKDEYKVWTDEEQEAENNAEKR